MNTPWIRLAKQNKTKQQCWDVTRQCSECCSISHHVTGASTPHLLRLAHLVHLLESPRAATSHQYLIGGQGAVGDPGGCSQVRSGD